MSETKFDDLGRAMCETNLKDGLSWIGGEIQRVNEANGWDVMTPGTWSNALEKYLPPTKIALLISEATEMLEAFRNDDKANFAEEAADVFIRLLDITHTMGIDLASAVIAKTEKNASRGHRHGGKRV